MKLNFIEEAELHENSRTLKSYKVFLHNLLTKGFRLHIINLTNCTKYKLYYKNKQKKHTKSVRNMQSNRHGVKLFTNDGKAD